MTLNEITASANAFTDENFSATLVKNYVNRAIAIINATLDATLPLITDVETNYTALNDSYITLLLVPYASYGIKANDGSLNEADRYKQEFQEGFKVLEQNKYKAIDAVYRGTGFGGMYMIDTSSAINVGWFPDKTPEEL